MSDVEIEIESGKSHCEDCPCMKGDGGGSKESLMSELKMLLNDNRPNGQSERQSKIDEVMSKINDMKEGY